MPRNAHPRIETVKMANAVLMPEIAKLIEEGHTVTLRLRGFSMRPFLEDNRDKALLIRPGQPKVGQPVLAEIEKGHFVLHRIIKIDGDAVTLRGDGNLNDEHCRISDIKALATGFYRKGRDTMDSIDGMKWRTYSWIWMHLYPIRRWLLAFYRRIWLKFF